MISTVNVTLGVILWVQCFSGSNALHSKVRRGCCMPQKLHTCFSREPATPAPHSHTHHHSWFSVMTSFCWPRHWHITPPAERVSQLVGRALIFQWEMISCALRMKHTSAAMSTPKAERQSFIQLSRVSESGADRYPDVWKMPELTITWRKFAALPTV